MKTMNHTIACIIVIVIGNSCLIYPLSVAEVKVKFVVIEKTKGAGGK